MDCKKNDDGRYIARAPRLGVLIRDLHKKLEKILVQNIYYQKIFHF